MRGDSEHRTNERREGKNQSREKTRRREQGANGQAAA
jgi:hypothetical protein